MTKPVAIKTEYLIQPADVFPMAYPQLPERQIVDGAEHLDGYNDQCEQHMTSIDGDSKGERIGRQKRVSQSHVMNQRNQSTAGGDRMN